MSCRRMLPPRPPPVRRPSPRPARSPNEPPTRWPQRSMAAERTAHQQTAAPQVQQARQGQQAVRESAAPARVRDAVVVATEDADTGDAVERVAGEVRPLVPDLPGLLPLLSVLPVPGGGSDTPGAPSPSCGAPVVAPRTAPRSRATPPRAPQTSRRTRDRPGCPGTVLARRPRRPRPFRTGPVRRAPDTYRAPRPRRHRTAHRSAPAATSRDRPRPMSRGRAAATCTRSRPRAARTPRSSGVRASRRPPPRYPTDPARSSHSPARVGRSPPRPAARGRNRSARRSPPRITQPPGLAHPCTRTCADP
ncbi:hypothetical protein SFIMM107S_00326 [Streptomyces griseus]